MENIKSKIKTVLVTGAATGIGRAVAEYFLEQGANVAALDNNQEMLAQLPKEILQLHADVSNETQVQNAVEKTALHFGNLHVLVNNAAIATSNSGPIEKLTLENWNLVLTVNLTGPMLCSKHAAPHLQKTGGAIINIASTRALQSEKNSEAYTASKGGLVALTHALAISLGPAVRVNCVSPGWIETSKNATHSQTDKNQHPVGRVGMPTDVAAMVGFLCSEEAGFITGQNFIVDGGMSKKMIYAE